MRLTMEQFQRKVQTWHRRAPETLRLGLTEAAIIVTKEVRDKHLGGPKMARGRGSSTSATLAPVSGKLLASVGYRVSVTGDRIKAEVGTNLKYARIHEYGGIIKPVKGKFLKFEIGGRTIFAKQVKIPARPFLRPSVKAKRPEVVRILADHFMRSYDLAE